MDFTLMIIVKDGTQSGGYGLTSQLKTYPTRELAERVAERIADQAHKSSNRVEVLKLYL